MLRDRIEAKWIDAFVRVFELCKVQPGEACAILSETQSRRLNVHLAELALARLGAVGVPRRRAVEAAGRPGAGALHRRLQRASGPARRHRGPEGGRASSSI